MTASPRSAFAPTTRLGEWAIGLAVVSVGLLLTWTVVGRIGGVAGLGCGLAGGVSAFVAIARRGERSPIVFLALAPFAMVAAFVLAELFG